jgi:hypothetical protein
MLRENDTFDLQELGKAGFTYQEAANLIRLKDQKEAVTRRNELAAPGRRLDFAQWMVLNEKLTEDVNNVDSNYDKRFRLLDQEENTSKPVITDDKITGEIIQQRHLDFYQWMHQTGKITDQIVFESKGYFNWDNFTKRYLTNKPENNANGSGKSPSRRNRN